LRTADISLPPRAHIQYVTVSVSNCVGFYLTGVPKEWLASCASKGTSYTIDFWHWPVAPGETDNTRVAMQDLDQVFLVDPNEDPSGMPVRPRVSVHVRYSDVGPSGSPYMVSKSLVIDDAKVELKRWKQTGLSNR
jgi:hypothetical protein